MAISTEEVEKKVVEGKALTDEEKTHVMGLTSEEKAEKAGPPDETTKKPPTPQEKPEDKPAVAEEPKQQAPAPAQTLAKVEEQLNKPDGTEDLSGFSFRERSLFREMRHERRERQRIQKELEELKFERLQAKAQEPVMADDEPILAKTMKEREDALRQELRIEHEMKLRPILTSMWHREAKSQHPDLDTVLDAGKAIVDATPEYQQKIQEAYEDGENVALVIYDLVTSDKRYAPPVATPPAPPAAPPAASKEALENAKKMQENAEKVKTTGAVGGGSGDAEEMTLEWVRGLSQGEFMNLPDSKRREILKKFG